MKFFRIILILLSLVVNISLWAKMSDSVKFLNTEIHLKIKNFASKSINGYCIQNVKFLKSSNKLSLDLSSLIVDSIFYNNLIVNYSKVNDNINITLPTTQSVGSTCDIKVYYHGTPAADPSGWGGFYFSGDYAFNLGVGFQVNPHSYGRAWFPCIDEFEIKNSYDFYIETDTNYMAACNGLLMSSFKNGNSTIWHYRETNPMSAYLASVTVSKFTVLKSNFNGI